MSEVLLQARGLQIRFGGVVAADGIDLDIMRGERLAIIGPNGAGKTTFLNICTGYLRPQGGTVSFEGHEITAQPPREITRLGIARAFQIPQLFAEHSVIECMLIAAASRERRWAPLSPLAGIPERGEMVKLLELVGCAHAQNRRAAELPEGFRKLVDIAVALALKPRLLLMDEPTSGVASAEKFQIMDVLAAALAEQKVTSVFVEHDMDVVTRFADRVAVWSGGRIQKIGPTAEVLKDADVIRTVTGR
ncbi:daunorubicin/doxorubicin resistance ATP-binding protein DrrA [Variibacter gotjawalensis]|uniref:Daunorubicin/doxorubicin resistance ATP-binding protein DrrA n=1 Tax=Variibacter gotjawalensis TaxID=1333996 RepID=A0A0S3PZD5_9BRAD|nr:ATP-binding cassette domain-containing protein [Variibacter gotjawalensis]NIK47084.1 branched-chain amino acid transport system ATP-binding protein [Variibacter gotjawalensis]RZS48986.1 amino acid/amide ABC transporter ATP-binding protein 1 (HAAT family) [Variibacter gotjawalensis]BAT61246.1 daunorubicin/doxorubicin resistance ATP-binding protein DrrA [Variibacter gotjawalensis]